MLDRISVESNPLVRGFDVLHHYCGLLEGVSDLVSVVSNPLITGFDALHHLYRLLGGGSDHISVGSNPLIIESDVLRRLWRLLGGGSDPISVGSNPLIRGFDSLSHLCRLLKGGSDLNRCGIEPFDSSDRGYALGPLPDFKTSFVMGSASGSPFNPDISRLDSYGNESNAERKIASVIGPLALSNVRGNCLQDSTMLTLSVLIVKEKKHMEDIESTKTSDEIINELFSSLNVPLSPKPCEEEGKDKQQQRGESTEPEVIPASDNSEDEDSDSRSSASEEVKQEEVQVIEAGSQEMEKAERHRSSKKKKDKKKKKKKKKKKEEGSSKHKHKKKRKKDAEKEHNGREEAKGAEEVLEVKQAEEEEEEEQQPKEKEKDQEKTQPPTPEDKKSEKLPSQSESPKRPEKVPKMVESENKLKRKLAVETETREESSRKHKKTDHSRSSRSSSPSKSRSHTRTSRRSRSRSVGRGHSRYSRSRSRSKSKPHSYSRSHSRSHRKSRSRSPFASDRRRRKRSSRSYSRSASPKRFKRRRSSRSRSKSPSGRSSSSRRSGSRSKSRAKAPYPREVCDLLDKARERMGQRDASKAQSAASIDVSSIPTPGSTTIPRLQGTLSDIIALDSIPLPIPAPAAPDPSSIPLPQPLGHSDETLKKDAHSKGINGIGLDLETIPVPAPTNVSPQKDQDSARAGDVAKGKQEEGAEKNKAKTIIIKSLKDSLVFLQAQEEAERKAKENAELEEEEKTVEHSAEDVDEEEEEEDEGDEEDEDKEEEEEEQEEEEEEEKKENEEQESKDGEELREGEEEGEKEEEEEEEEEIKEIEIKGSEGKTNDPSSGSDTKSEPACATDVGKVPKETREKVEKNGKGDKDGAKVKTEEKEETLNGMEEGEIASEEEEPQEKSQSKPHKKKSKKDKDKHKDKRKSKKEKDKNKEDKKKKRRERERSRSRTRERAKSRSRSRSHDRGRSQTRSRTHERGRSRSRSRSRERHKSRRHSSRSRDRSSRVRHKSRSRSRSRSKSHSHRKRDSVNDLRDKVTRKRLLEIARRNAVYLMQNGCLPPSVEQEQLVKIKAGGKSVEELTNFCKQLVATGNYSDVDLSEPSLSSGDDNENSDKPFSTTRHPFSVRDSKPILMNIRNAPMLPTKTNAERLADQAKLREQFPVSSGSQHRTKGELTATEGKLLTESSWVPVSPKEKKEGEDKVFPEPEPVVSDRKGQKDFVFPQTDPKTTLFLRECCSYMCRYPAASTVTDPFPFIFLPSFPLLPSLLQMQNWALSKQEPGQFTGSTGVKVLSQEELSAGHQAWARKEQFKEAAPVRPQFGLKMLQKMGWSPGEGLGKNKEGTLEPLLLDVKMDKKGFHAQEELTPKKQPIPLAKDLSEGHSVCLASGKHPVSALVELCSKRKWSPPEFEMVFDCGPEHKKNFLMKVMVNGQEYKPSVAASTKKLAKANAAAACLQSLGLFPKDPANPL
ncbi:LOW QUALITY PROTEIN: protein Son-like [Penaeus chinensis]|uniref:LOW QUALITY PROTEIN: protein Son-like n=2 Tax=Penaeus TaxID=133894 RepID=UPI001FB60688|nr:LOW QUALITY PROTEIN: protein Son-like [Penaeus chinensis]